jgi:hypothetical protein
MTYSATKAVVAALLAETPVLGPERLPSAARDFERLMPAIRAGVAASACSPEESRRHNREFRAALLQIVSLESAAGASIQRCRRWFRCLRALSAWRPVDADAPISSSDAAIWWSLDAGFREPPPADWPETADAEGAEEQAIYSLVTGNRPRFRPRDLHDDVLWKRLHVAIEQGHSSVAAQLFASIADWWLEEYAATDTAPYDPEHHATFEPGPNAALALALLRERLEIPVLAAKHQRFYYVALMVAQDEGDRGT